MLKLDQKKYEKLIKDLAKIVGKDYDLIIAIGRGGLYPGLRLSHILNIPLGLIASSSYDGKEARTPSYGEFSIPRGILTINKILILDDLTDRGFTLADVSKLAMKRFQNLTEIKTAVLLYKTCSLFKPDFYSKEVGTEWVEFPYES